VTAAATATSLHELEPIAAAAPPNAGIAFDGVGGSELYLGFVPPIPALELEAMLGWPESFGETSDVHQSSWRLKFLVTDDSSRPYSAPPSYGRWNVRAALDGRPTGGEIADPSAPLGGRHRLGPKDLVRGFALGSY
jgi:hypothetical protein